MKKIIILSLAVLISGGAMAAKKKEVVNKNKPVFTTVLENKISSIKDQSRSGTCWNYSTLSYFESEILKKSGKEYNLCEMFVCNKTYMDRAIQVVRLHGDCQFAQGGSCYDPLFCIQNYGICPEEAMPFPGSFYSQPAGRDGLETHILSKEDRLENRHQLGLQGCLGHRDQPRLRGGRMGGKRRRAQCPGNLGREDCRSRDVRDFQPAAAWQLLSGTPLRGLCRGRSLPEFRDA